MGIVRRYRPVALTIAILLALAVFLGFFFLFVLVPVVVIGLFYVLFAVSEWLKPSPTTPAAPTGRQVREADTRRSLLARRDRLGVRR